MPNSLHSVASAVSDGSNAVEAYQTNWEYLGDQLKRLDILIQFQLVKLRDLKPVGLFDDLKGLVISEEEINLLLKDDKDVSFDPEVQLLSEELTRLNYVIDSRKAASEEQRVCLALPYLVKIFNLSAFEEQCLIICLAPELDRKYEKLYAYLQDDVTRKKPSVDLILSLLLNKMEDKIAARSVFEPEAPLLKFLLKFVDISEETVPLISRFIKLEDRIVNFILGMNDIDQRLRGIVRLVGPSHGPNQLLFIPEDFEWIRQTAQAAIGGKPGEAGKRIVFYFYGPCGAGKKTLVRSVCRELGIPVLIADYSKIPVSQATDRESLQLLGREAILQQAALCIDNLSDLADSRDKSQSDSNILLDMIPSFPPLTFLLGGPPWRPAGPIDGTIFVEREFTVPTVTLRKKYWESFGKQYHLSLEIDLAVLAGSFKFTPGQIRDSLINAEHLALRHANRQSRIEMADLYTACHNQSNHRLGSLARKLKPKYTWDDIVLPRDRLRQLHEICNQVKYRQVVYDEWGFDQKLSVGKGLNALFSGPPGTGKTMAAEVIANVLLLEIYKIDLSRIVSKYIGETEKNLDKIFTEAETSNAILFFDEADALFGKRSEVKDAHDRYANIEIGYLLQRMEEYEGLVILATNLNNNIDEAFLRRMHSVVEFPFPDIEQREEMWRKIFPEDAPKGSDVDYGFLAARLKIAGGNIKNIALSAAFYAANEAGVIGMKHILLAARREYQKIGKAFFKSDLEPYARLLEAESDVTI